MSVEALKTGLSPGLFDAWARRDGGVLKFRPETVAFVRWSSQLIDKVAAGETEPVAASERLWRWARQTAKK